MLARGESGEVDTFRHAFHLRLDARHGGEEVGEVCLCVCGSFRKRAGMDVRLIDLFGQATTDGRELRRSSITDRTELAYLIRKPLAVCLERRSQCCDRAFEGGCLSAHRSGRGTEPLSLCAAGAKRDEPDDPGEGG